MAQARITNPAVPRLFQILPPEMPLVWPGVRHWLERAFEWGEGQYTLDALFACIMKQTHQLWVGEFRGAPFAAAVTQIMKYPSGAQICLVEVLGGTEDSMSMLGKLLGDLEHWAMTFGCTGIQMETRPGMAKFLSSRGYDRKKFLMSKGLKKELH